MWVTFASGYQVVYQALVVILAGLILYAFMNARRQRLVWRLNQSKRPNSQRWTHDADHDSPGFLRPSTYRVDSEVGQLRQAIIHRPGWSFHDSRRTISRAAL